AGVGHVVAERVARYERLAVTEDRVARREVEARDVAAVGIGQALEERLALVADELPHDPFVHRPRLAQPVERRVRIVLEGTPTGRVHVAAQVEELPQPLAVEGVVVVRRGHWSSSSWSRGTTSSNSRSIVAAGSDDAGAKIR